MQENNALSFVSCKIQAKKVLISLSHQGEPKGQPGTRPAIS